jgi:hypothetical protein
MSVVGAVRDARHGFFDITCKLLIDRCRRTLRQQGDAILDGSAWRRWHVQDSHWRRALLNDNLGSSAYARQ